MRANGKRAGEWSDEEYHKRKAKSEAERNGLPYIALSDIARGKPEKPAPLATFPEMVTFAQTESGAKE